LGKYYKINHHIKAESIRVINDQGEQLGVMTLRDALQQAQDLGLDLIEVAENAKPPVVKMIEFSKFKYQESKKDRAGASKSSQSTKEIRMAPFMAENDLKTKVEKAKECLEAGDKVRLVVKFTGREIVRKEFGERIMASAIEMLSEVGTVLEKPKMLGKLLISQIKPKKSK
jgi:translation initiation factor IF-3